MRRNSIRQNRQRLAVLGILSRRRFGQQTSRRNLVDRRYGSLRGDASERSTTLSPPLFRARIRRVSVRKRNPP